MVVSAIEHPSVLESASFLIETIQPGLEIDVAPVTSDGVVDIEAYRALLRADTALVSVMLANNESGVIQPVSKLAAIAKAANPGCLFHTDATQAVTKIPVSLEGELHAVDFLSLSAHKFHGPKGVGALFVRTGSHLDPLIQGGGQQRGYRSGTDNPALAAGIAKAADIPHPMLFDQNTVSCRDKLEAGLSELGLTILGLNAPRLPNTSLVLFPGVDSETVVHWLLERGFAASTGSACSSGSDAPSHVVLAMGIDYSSAFGALRVSLSHRNTADDIAEFLEAICTFPFNEG
jgi:cysteine desulfurase